MAAHPQARRQSSNWCFTVNNYSDENIANLKSLYPETAKYLIIGKEEGENGTPHLQCFIQLKKRSRFNQVLSLFTNLGLHPHIEACNGSADQNREYCIKDGDFEELGEKPPKKGKRSDLDQLYQLIKDGLTDAEIREAMPGTYMRYHKAVAQVRAEMKLEQGKLHSIITHQIDLLKPKTKLLYVFIGMERLKLQNLNVILKQWQSDIIERLQTQSDRQITWIYDRVGNCGKSWLARYLVTEKKAAYMQNAKAADLAFAYNGENMVVFDYTRDKEDYINYSILESLKNGILFSPKYASGQKIFAPATVVCFANFPPDYTKLSLDRWDVLEVLANGELTQRDAYNPPVTGFIFAEDLN